MLLRANSFLLDYNKNIRRCVIRLYICNAAGAWNGILNNLLRLELNGCRRGQLNQSARKTLQLQKRRTQ